MSFIKFLFVLLIIVPVAVVMIYIINNLNRDVRESNKNEERNKTAVKNTVKDDLRRKKQKEKPERGYETERTDTGRGYGGYGDNTGSSRQELGGSFSRQIPDRDRYKKESAYYINKQKRTAGGDINRTEEAKNVKRSGTDRTKTASKRKRRKERKNKRKVRER